MKIKTCNLIGKPLDWAVSEAEGVSYADYMEDGPINQRKWSTDWSQGGPIIEREGIELSRDMGVYPILPDGSLGVNLVHKWMANIERHWQYGPTPLIAAMRCYVASKLGTELEVPDGLV